MISPVEGRDISRLEAGAWGVYHRGLDSSRRLFIVLAQSSRVLFMQS
jgi:hypothetical protein